MYFWWGALFLVGLIMGGVASWRGNALRVFIRTLGLPLSLALLWYYAPAHWQKNDSTLGLCAAYLVLVLSAFAGDYLIGLLLGKNDAAGYREDAVGH